MSHLVPNHKLGIKHKLLFAHLCFLHYLATKASGQQCRALKEVKVLQWVVLLTIVLFPTLSLHRHACKWAIQPASEAVP